MRITNAGPVEAKSLTVLFPEDRVAFGDIAAGETTEYRAVPHGVYRYAAYRLEIDGEMVTQPVIDWVGENPMQGSAFAYVIDVDPTRAPWEIVRLIRVTEDDKMAASTPSAVTATPAPYPPFTPQPTASPTSLPTVVPPIETVSAANLPQLTHDLLFLNLGRLMRWDHKSAEIELLAGPNAALENPPPSPPGSVLSFSVDATGQRIAVARRTDGGNIELALIGLTTRRLTSLARVEAFGLQQLSISPDGRWVAYIPRGTEVQGVRISGRAARAASPLAGGPNQGIIYAVRTDAPHEQVRVGFCALERFGEGTQGCKGFVWSPDSRAVLWSDGRGVWLAGLNQDTARKLVSTEIGMPSDPEAGAYYPLAWSPAGQYVLVRIGYFEGSGYGVLDSYTGDVARVPSAFWYVGPRPHATWLDDGRLFVTRPGSVATDQPPVIEFWQVLFDQEVPLKLDRSIPVSVGNDNSPVGPAQLQGNRVAFALLNSSNTDYQACCFTWLSQPQRNPFA